MSDSLNLPLKILKSGPGINLVAFAGRTVHPLCGQMDSIPISEDPLCGQMDPSHPVSAHCAARCILQTWWLLTHRAAVSLSSRTTRGICGKSSGNSIKPEPRIIQRASLLAHCFQATKRMREGDREREKKKFGIV